MLSAVTLRSISLWLAGYAILPYALAQQPGQTGSGTSGSTGGTSGAAGGSTAGGSTAGTSRSISTPQPANNAPSQMQRQQSPYIIGSVVMEDGTPPPLGVYIERVCSGQTRREAYVMSGGHFSFQIGGNSNLMFEASDAGPEASESPWQSAPRTSGMPADLGLGGSTKLMGCELRAQLPGYRSSVVTLSGGQLIGSILDAGTIVLCPLAKAPGTTVSATSLQAPKDAKKALERAGKAFQKSKLEEAEKNLRSAVEIYPRYASAWSLMGRVYYQQSRIEDARLAFSKAMEADSFYVYPYVELARIAAQEQKWQQVADLTDRAVALDPLDFPDGFVLNALANFNLKKLEAAEGSARKAQRLDPSHRFLQPYLILASILQQKQDRAGEAQQLRSYLKYAPQTPNAERVRSRLLDLERTGSEMATREPPRP